MCIFYADTDEAKPSAVAPTRKPPSLSGKQYI